MRLRVILICGMLAALVVPAQAQLDPHTTTVDAAAAASAAARRRTRLYLKDGSYQVVMSYKVAGAKVTYVSAERAGETEEIPLALVDMDRTRQWEKDHAPVDPNAPPRPAPAIDPELLKEEAERAALSPEIAKDLRLDPQYSVLVMDTWHAGAELVPLTQSEGGLNHQTSHNVVRGTVNPNAHPHPVITLKGEKSAVQMHVNEPVFYLHLDDETGIAGPALTVDTHGASSYNGVPRHNDDPSFVIVRTDVRQDARVIASFDTYLLGSGQRQEDLIETKETPVAGGHWLKIEPAEKLLIGEYALLEVLSGKEINLSVWDFGVHPTAPENRDVLLPEKQRALRLERHVP